MNRIRAVQAATDALNKLGLDQTAPIDPFAAIEAFGLRLSFKPMSDLLGAILPGNPGGVLINSARPASLQRYTAAHELGHWHLDQDALSLDSAESVLGRYHHDSREREAQLFASYFLMPLELVYSTARRYGIAKDRFASPEQVYQAARDMHVSYEAAVRQLLNTRIITSTNQDALLRTQPANIKRRLMNGLPLPNARGEVWVIDSPIGRAHANLVVGDAVLLRLDEMPTTGYRWCSETALRAAAVASVQPAPSRFDDTPAFPDRRSEAAFPLPSAGQRSDVVSLFHESVTREEYTPAVTPVGAPITRLVAYVADSPGNETLRLSYVRPFAPQDPISHVELSLAVQGPPEAEFRRRLLEDFARWEAEKDGWDANA